MAIRRNHGVWLPKGQTVRCNRWHASCSNGGNLRTALARKFDLIFSDGTQEVRMLREIVFGKKRSRRFWTSVAGGSFHRHSLGDYDRPVNNAPQLKGVCDDRDAGVELQRCWKSLRL